MNKKFMIGSGIVVLVVVAFFIFSSSATEVVVSKDVVSGNVKEFSVEAFRFGYSPDVVRVKQGDSVRLVVDNLDFVHGIRIPDLGVAGMDSVEFVANEKGEFVWYCNNFCGEGHMAMSGMLIVE